jgi:hypothetical protein
MEWIKTRYDRFLLLVAAIILIAVSVLVILKALSFTSQFALSPETGGAKIPEADKAAVESALERLEKPAKWTTADNSGRLLVSRAYLEINGQLIDPTDPSSPAVHPPLTNKWILDNNLPVKDPNLLTLDSDDDGFENIVEWENGQTEPDDANSHPDYPVKLFFGSIKRNPFHLKFSAITSKDVFQIDATNSGEPTQFRSLGETITGSDWKLESFKEVLVPQPNGTNKDKSELTITSAAKGQTVTLVLGEPLNVGEDDAIMSFKWKGEESIARRKGQKFTLKPEPGVEYTVEEIADDHFTIKRVKDGKQYMIKKQP